MNGKKRNVVNVARCCLTVCPERFDVRDIIKPNTTRPATNTQSVSQSTAQKTARASERERENGRPLVILWCLLLRGIEIGRPVGRSVF